jgi:hypothetical protein
MKSRAGVSNAVFAGTAIILLILAGIGFALYFSNSPSTQTTTENMTETMTHMSTTAVTVTSNGTDALEFTPVTGQMIHSAWLLIEPAGMDQYALAIHAEGLENTQSMGSDYIVEGAQSSGSMSVVPIGPNATASEFDTNGNGVGNFFILLSQNPYTTFENIQIVYLPGMQMTNATVVATASLTMMSH